MVVVPDPWLSEILEQSAYKIVMMDGPFSENAPENAPKNVKDELSKFLATQVSNTFVYCKTSTSLLKSAHVLESLGFRLIDTHIVLEKSLSRNQDLTTQANIQFAVPEDEHFIVELARRTFKYSRFHLDPLIRKARADQIKAEWVRNYFLGKRGEWLVTARVNGTYAGFLLLLKDEKKVLTIDLIGVDEGYRKMGIARSMISYAETYCKDVDRIRVGTQIANISSINLYEKMGFRLVDSNYVFHYHHS